MAKYKPYDYDQMVMIPVRLKEQLEPGTLEYAIHELVEERIDVSLFEVPFVIDYEFVQTGEDEVPLYECTDADYDWFEKLNAPADEESR